MLLTHDGHDGLSDRDVREEIGLELFAEFGKGNVFCESRSGESGVVDEDVYSMVVANDVGDELRKGRVVCDIEAANFNAFGEAFAGGEFVESGAGGGIAHGGDDVESAECEFDGGEHSDAAGGSGDESDLVQFVSWQLVICKLKTKAGLMIHDDGYGRCTKICNSSLDTRT